MAQFLFWIRLAVFLARGSARMKLQVNRSQKKLNIEHKFLFRFDWTLAARGGAEP
jgi:hypothetical protein